ncbi:MAG: RHS repeat-associated core domain-containing protein [Thermodesulfovibrionales bacterium]
MRNSLKLYVCLIIAIFLLSTYTFAAEKVFFYYTDPAGTPLAMTDQSGNVVWRADYKPFGEEQSVTQSPENVIKFVGKEKDKETGLHNIGVRYMKDEIGRFISPDPVGPVNPLNSKTNLEMLLNPQRLNLYAYSLNNPYRYMDANGRWPTPVHNTIINRAFEGTLSPAAISALQRGSKEADSLKYQGQAFSYMHAMSNALTNQSPEEATRLMNNYISQSVNEYKTLMSQGKTDAAYEALGMAMHPLMDATSPSHEGMQGWAGTFPIIDGTTMKAYIHGRKETEDVFNSNPAYSSRAVESIKKIYNEANQ